METTTALETTTPIAVTTLGQHIAALIPEQELRDRFAAVLVNQIHQSADLQKCSPDSLVAAVAKIAQLRLDPALPNEVWIVAYWNKRTGKHEAQPIIGYGGLRTLVLRTGAVVDVLCEAVREHDDYHSPRTRIELPEHRLPANFGLRGKAIGYYAAAQLRVGHWRVVEMSRAEVKAHKELYSRAADSTFWSEGKPDHDGLSNFDKMALKTVLRQLCSPRHLPLSAEVVAALGTEEAILRERSQEGHVPRLTTPAQSREATVSHGVQAANDVFGGSVGIDDTPQDNTNAVLVEYIVEAMLEKGYPRDKAAQYCQSMASLSGLTEISKAQTVQLERMLGQVRGWPNAAQKKPPVFTQEVFSPEETGTDDSPPLDDATLDLPY